MIFVNSMSDLFQEAVPASFVDEVWKAMALTPHHTYQILTKRRDRTAALPTTADTAERMARREHRECGLLRPTRRSTTHPCRRSVRIARAITRIGRGDRPDVVDSAIVGGESGPGARPMDPVGAQIRDGVPLDHVQHSSSNNGAVGTRSVKVACSTVKPGTSFQPPWPSAGVLRVPLRCVVPAARRRGTNRRSKGWNTSRSAPRSDGYTVGIEGAELAINVSHFAFRELSD